MSSLDTPHFKFSITSQTGILQNEHPTRIKTIIVVQLSVSDIPYVTSALAVIVHTVREILLTLRCATHELEHPHWSVLDASIVSQVITRGHKRLDEFVISISIEEEAEKSSERPIFPCILAIGGDITYE